MARGRGRRLGLIAAGAAVLATGAPPAADAADAGPRIVTLDDPAIAESPYVDPDAAPPGAYGEPPGVPDRPNALRANVYLPRGYRPGVRRRWPVLYLFPGYGDAFDSWAHPARGDLLRLLPDFRGFIVMPEAERSHFANWLTDGGYGMPQWERYHLDQLIPEIERRLPVRPGRRWRAIAGVSMGGQGAMLYAARRPGWFGAAVSMSGVLHVERDRVPRETLSTEGAAYGAYGDHAWNWRGHNPVKLAANLRHTRLYVSVGNGQGRADRPLDPTDQLFSQYMEAELAAQARAFVRVAGDAGARVTYAPREGVHGWRLFREQLVPAVRWGLFRRPVPTRGRRWTYDTVAQQGVVWGLRYRFAARPDEIVRLERFGRRLVGNGSGSVTITRPSRGTRCTFTVTLPFERRLPRGC